MEPQEVTAIIRIDPLGDPAIYRLLQEAQYLRAYAEALDVATVEDVMRATDDLNVIAKLKRALEDHRKEFTGPINDNLKAVNGAFKALLAPLDEADAITRAKVMSFKREEARKAAEIEEINRLKMEAARKEAALNFGEISETVQLLQEAAPVPTRIHGATATLGTMKVRKWEVQDLAKVPDEYKVIDAGRVGKLVKAGIPSIPGIRIWDEETLAVRGRTYKE